MGNRVHHRQFVTYTIASSFESCKILFLKHFRYSYACGDFKHTYTGFVFSSLYLKPIAVASWSKASTVFARSNTGIVGSNPTRGMDVSARLFCVCVVLCVSSGLATG
jgi:hypothetical protein